MNRRILYVLLFSLLYHIGYKPAFAAEMGHGIRKSPIATVGYKDRLAHRNSQEYIQIDTGTLINEQEDDEEIVTASKLYPSLKWSFYQYYKAIPLTGKRGHSHRYKLSASDKDKYILIRAFRL